MPIRQNLTKRNSFWDDARNLNKWKWRLSYRMEWNVENWFVWVGERCLKIVLIKISDKNRQMIGQPLPLFNITHSAFFQVRFHIVIIFFFSSYSSWSCWLSTSSYFLFFFTYYRRNQLMNHPTLQYYSQFLYIIFRLVCVCVFFCSFRNSLHSMLAIHDHTVVHF